ncbi:scaffold protein Nfu/NifU N terminal-domain-containing protein [Infundibulicybe gibba]|nr:scaffold protein Nfu/NifU N terminal-domain-containing protein [Infundibulicybe gibba]
MNIATTSLVPLQNISRRAFRSIPGALRSSRLQSHGANRRRGFAHIAPPLLFSNSNTPRGTNIPALARSMFIQTETTPNDDSLKFIPGVPVMGDGTAEFLDTRTALTSPLAIRLMGVEGVSAVFYGPDFVTVSKDSENPWAVVKPEIYSILMEFFSSGQALFRSEEEKERAGPQDTRILDTDSETVAMIKELLETRVRPAIMEDGGDIEYRGFDESGTGLVKVKLKGSCRGCDSSTVTLKSGIERMLMHYIPEVKGVEQILDEEEEIALNEFSKLEEKLAAKSPAKSGMAQYMSV